MQEKFKPRQRQILGLLAEGYANAEIASELGLAIEVVKGDLRVIYNLSGMWSRLELALWYEAHRNEFEIAKGVSA